MTLILYIAFYHFLLILLLLCCIIIYHYCPVKAGKSVFEIVET